MTKTFISFLLVLFSLQLVVGQDCEITAVNATPSACTGNYFMVSINLEVNNPSSPGFTLAGNGTIYGTYLYADLPITIGPFLGDDVSVYEFIVWDVDNGDCQNSTTLPAPNCGPICGFSNANLDLVICQSSNASIVTFDFDHANTNNPAFDLFYANGSMVGSWLYQSLPVTITGFQGNGAAPITLTICDHNSTDCCQAFTFDAIDCNPNNCEIFSVTADPDCINNSSFVVHLDFQYDNPASDSFSVTGNTLDYGKFAYADIPVTIGPLNGNTNINWTFVIKDSGNPNCQATKVLGVYHCPPPCAIDSIGANAFLCNGNDFYMLQLGLAIEGQGNSGFDVFSASDYYGNHSYTDLPLVIENFSGSGDFVDHVTVCDHANPQCCATAVYEALLCSDCIIYNLTATPLPCNAEDEFMVLINFNHQNNSDQFTITGNGNSYGTFSYADLPIQVGPFNGATPINLDFVATDVVNALCFDGIEIGPVSCDAICQLLNLAVETGECSGANTYVAHINFSHEGMAGNGFTLSINGDFFNTYSYADLPLTIAQFPGSGSGHDTITVCAIGHPECCASLAFNAPACTCHIFEPTVQNLDCTSDSTFAISLNFSSENTPNHNIDVYLNDVYLGFYNAENLPVLLTNIPEGDGTAVLRVCASDHSDCCAEVEVQLMMCESAQCHIWNLYAEHGDCNSDSTYLLDFNFNYINLPTDSITVTANGQHIGTYLIDPQYNRIEHFPVLENDTIHLLVCAAGAPDCCEDLTYIAPDCSLFGQCNIWNLVAFIGDCQSDSTYLLHVEFNYTNLPGDSVHITANGNDFGNYAVNNGSIFLQNFPAFSGETTTVNVCAAGNENCCAILEYSTPGCAGINDCHIFDLQAFVGDCTSDSTYILHVEFNYNNLPGDSVVITANGNELGHHALNDGNFYLEYFPIYDTEQTIITVCALGSADCCDVFDFITPDCTGGGVCHIYDLVADPGDCTSDSTYNLLLHYFTNNLPSDSVIIIANGHFIGEFLHNPDGIMLTNFPAYQTDYTHIGVCAVGAPDCCDDIDFLTPNCNQGDVCQIYDLIGIIGDCQSDSTYILHLEFNYANLPSDSVHIVVNGNDFGNYFINEGSIFLENLPVYGTANTVVTVCAVGSPDCCDVIEFESPNCEGGGTCHIFDLAATVGECTSDSSFVLNINYYSNNLPGDSVIVFANDIYVGTFASNPEGLIIENFPKVNGEVTHLLVCAVGAQDCCDSYDFETPFCTSECIIYNIQVQPFGCTSDSTFSAVIHFDYQNITAGGFDLFAGDHYLGFYTFEQLPIQTNQFPSNSTGQYLVTVCESDNTECCATANFTGPTCGESACHIYDLGWTMTECDSNGVFYFILNFQFDNIGDNGFNVYGNGNNYGNFNYANLPLQLGPFEANATDYEFAVSDGAHPECFDVVNPGVVTCNVSNVSIRPDEYFAIFNNGTIPGVLARQNVTVSLYNANGKSVLNKLNLNQDAYYEFKNIPDGFYILIVNYGQQTWPVKLIRTGY
jgi:hypothetical protein